MNTLHLIPTAIDNGYRDVKARIEDRRVIFPSAAGSPDTSRFSLSMNRDIMIHYDGTSYLVGQSAVRKSQFVGNRRVRGWIETDEYMVLFHAALSELSNQRVNHFYLVTGLPVRFYEADQNKLNKLLFRTHVVTREGRDPQVFHLTGEVIEQPWGTVLDAALNENGKIVSQEMMGNVGVIDAGGYTTDYLTVFGLEEISRETDGMNIGGWNVTSAMRTVIEQKCPDLTMLKDYEIADAVKSKRIKEHGQWISLVDEVNEVVTPLASNIAKGAEDLWQRAGHLDMILITGGGAHLLGDHIKNFFPKSNVIIANKPVFANVNGYWKYAVRMHDSN
jgi:plasmid segregation protein ParM